MVAVAFASSACDDGESAVVDELLVDESLTPDTILPDEPSIEEAVDDEPDLVLEFEGGATLSFFIEDDGSVGMLEQIPADAKVASVLEDPWLSEASPAVVWYALTKDGEEIPEALRVHHEALAADGQVLPLEQALAKQIRNLAPIPLADEDSPCDNTIFDANHCDHPDYQDDLCFLNASGADLAWNVYEAFRYKAGFCLQAGTARSWLYYWPGVDPIDGECQYIRTANFVWGSGSYANGDRYSATTYLHYTWWRPSGVARRAFFHRAIGDTGSVFDFGNRYSWGGCG